MNTFTRRPEPEQTHFILGQGRLGLTLLNSFRKIGIPVVDVPEQADVIWFCLPETALKAEGKKFNYREVYTEHSPIRGYRSYQGPKNKG